MRTFELPALGTPVYFQVGKMLVEGAWFLMAGGNIASGGLMHEEEYLGIHSSVRPGRLTL